jgi:hypothetical protein
MDLLFIAEGSHQVRHRAMRVELLVVAARAFVAKRWKAPRRCPRLRE